MTAGDVVVVRESANSRQAVAFDGTDDYILVDAHAVARVGANDTTGTYTAWILLDSVATTRTILSAGDNDSTNEYLALDVVDGALRVFLKDAGATKFDVKETTPSVTAKTWHHVAVVHNGVRPTLYVDGVASAMTDTASTDLTLWYDALGDGPVDKFAIGVLESNNTHVNDLAGMVSHVKYFSLALTAAQIKTDFENRTADADVTAALQLSMDMDGDVLDAGLGADDGTLTGHAYNCGWGSAWSRGVELEYTGVTDLMNTVINGDIHTTIYVKNT